MDFPIFKTKKEELKVFNLSDPKERQDYFNFKAGPEIEKIKKHIEKGTFIVYLMGKKNSGKGTYAKMFAEIMGSDKIDHFSVGDMYILPPYGLWAAALKIVPQLTEFLQSIGIPLSNIDWDKWPPLRRVQPDHIHDWIVSLSTYFKTHWDDGEKLSIVDSIRRRGELSIFDCLIGTMQAPGSTGCEINSAIHFLLEAKGKGYPHGDDPDQYWKELSESRQLAFSVANKLEAWISPDPSFGDQQFAIYHDGKGFRIRPFAVFNNYQLKESPLPDGSLWIARGNIIQPNSVFSDEALDWLESLIDKNARESEFQLFFIRHPEFLLALGNYKAIHPQVILHEDIGTGLVPDFFLEKMNSDFCDICDLKRPTAELVRIQKHRVRFRDSVMEAVAQLEHYRDWFDDKDNRNVFYAKYGIRAFRPRIVAIIGRRQSYYDEVNRIKLESSLPRWVSLVTYDDVLDKAKQWKDFALRF